ncbi:MAG: DUF4369 domain-containing protein [Bacteroidales bacterium]|nr:DUF4369 domain-containing protein [Bacteroidales bacterium]
MKRFSALLLAAVVLVACHNTKIGGTIEGCEDGMLVLRQMKGGDLVFLDSVKVSGGSFSYGMDLEEGQPRFVYLYDKEGRLLGSFLASKGEDISFKRDSKGVCTVEGSEESAMLLGIENDYSAFRRDFEAAPDSLKTRIYFDYMKGRYHFLVANGEHLAILPIFFQTFPDGSSLFQEKTDAFRFRSAYETLSAKYPQSDYMPLLQKKTEERENAFRIATQLESADTQGFIDITLPDTRSEVRSLSEVDSPVVMLYFWLAADNRQKMLNNTMMKVVYDKYHDKGLEIFAVSFDEDRTEWARAVANQQLEWINVNDIRGLNSPYILTYNLTSIPVLFFLKDGEILESPAISGLEDLDKYLSGLLK